MEVIKLINFSLPLLSLISSSTQSLRVSNFLDGLNRGLVSQVANHLLIYIHVFHTTFDLLLSCPAPQI